MWGVLSGLIYYTSTLAVEVKSHDVINDLLRTAGKCLGKKYRINIMSLAAIENSEDKKFRIDYIHNISNVSDIDMKFDLNTPGVGTAFVRKESQVISGSDLLSNIDNLPSIVFSFPIMSKGHSPKAVLNIDTSHKRDSVDVDQIMKVGNQLVYAIRRHIR